MNIDRFVRGYDKYFEVALKEIESGQKTTHWMWFIFPQIKGLGHSYISSYYGIADGDEAREFYNRKDLRTRYIKLIKIVLRFKNKDEVEKCFGPIDALKFYSSISLFWLATKKRIFRKVLDKFYQGYVDSKTINLYYEHHK